MLRLFCIFFMQFFVRVYSMPSNQPFYNPGSYPGSNVGSNPVPVNMPSNYQAVPLYNTLLAASDSRNTQNKLGKAMKKSASRGLYDEDLQVYYSPETNSLYRAGDLPPELQYLTDDGKKKKKEKKQKKQKKPKKVKELSDDPKKAAKQLKKQFKQIDKAAKKYADVPAIQDTLNELKKSMLDMMNPEMRLDG